MRVAFNAHTVENKPNDLKQKSNKNTLLTVSACAVLAPFISFIDGEPLKKTYKERNIARYATGLVSIGGGVSALNILADKYISGTKNEPQKRLIKNMGLSALALSALSFVEYWAHNNKNFNKKYLILAPFLGAIVGAATHFVNKKNKK